MRHYTGELKSSKTHADRSWSFVATDGGEYLGTLAIRQGKREGGSYDVEEHAVHCGPVREFILRKQNEPDTFYAVLTDLPGTTCTCTGWGRHHHCKHTDAVAAALAVGAFDGPEPFTEPDAPAADPWPPVELLSEPAYADACEA